MEPTQENRRAGNRVHGPVFYASPFTVVGRVRSFRHAGAGFWFVMRSQHNAWLHAAATVAALILAGVINFRLHAFDLAEWAALVIAIVMVWVAETFNTGLEVLAEAISQERHPILKIAKDIAAAAVLLAAIGAFIVGAILFIPPFIEVIARAGGQ